MWGLLDEVDDLTTKEVVENTQNEDDFCNVLQPIQAFDKFHWV